MIYADYNGSAPLCDEVIKYLKARLDKGEFANPNAIHHLGQKTKMALENSRAHCAKILGALPKQITFNSGATEGITQAFTSVLTKVSPEEKPYIIISGIEHSAIIKCCNHFEKLNYERKVVKTTPDGVIDLDDLNCILSEHKNEIALISVMAANNETGVIQPYLEISKLCQKNQIPYICDTTQFIGKHEFDFQNSGVDYAVLSGHKIGAMTGTGFLLTKNPTSLEEIIFGGGQERGKRGGTENYLGYETIAIALEYFTQNISKLKELNKKRIEFENKIKKEFPSIVIIGEKTSRLSSTTFLSLPGTHGQAVQIELESDDIFITTSSACSDNDPSTSKVLKAMGIDDLIGRGATRISLGLSSPLENYDIIFESLCRAYKKLKKLQTN